jgi:hypothetical protein
MTSQTVDRASAQMTDEAPTRLTTAQSPIGGISLDAVHPATTERAAVINEVAAPSSVPPKQARFPATLRQLLLGFYTWLSGPAWTDRSRLERELRIEEGQWYRHM